MRANGMDEVLGTTNWGRGAGGPRAVDFRPRRTRRGMGGGEHSHVASRRLRDGSLPCGALGAIWGFATR